MTAALWILALVAFSVAGRHAWERTTRAGQRLEQLRQLHRQ